MAVNVRLDDGVAVLSNFGRLLNDPRHFDVGDDVRALLDEGHLKFVLELRTINETGSTILGLLMTITRAIRNRGGEVVLARPSRSMRDALEEMQLDDYWDIFDSVDEAVAFFED